MKTLLVAFVVLCLSTCGAAQPFMNQRLIAQSIYSDTNSLYPGNVAIADSFAMIYSSARHSEFDYSNMTYFDLGQTSGRSSLTARINAIAVPNNIDSANYALRLAFDTLRYYDYSSGSRQLVFEEGAVYATDGTCAQIYNKTGAALSTEKFFYAAGRLVSTTGAKYLNGTAGPTSRRFISHDAAGNAVLDSVIAYNNTGQPVSTDVTAFVFDGSGHYTSISQQSKAIRTRYSHYPDGRVQTRIIDDARPGGTFIPAYLDSFSYTPARPGYTGLKHFISFNGGWYPTGDVLFHFNALGQRDSMIVRGAGPDQIDLYYIAYNSLGNPSVRTHDAYYDGDFIYREQTFYYYELYNPALAAETLATKAIPIALAPNPATNSIILRDLPNVPVTIRIFNMLGQLLQAESCRPKDASARVTLSSSLIPGPHIVTVVTPRAEILYMGSFLKQ